MSGYWGPAIVVLLVTMSLQVSQKFCIDTRCSGSRRSRPSTGSRKIPSLRRMSDLKLSPSQGSSVSPRSCARTCVHDRINHAMHLPVKPQQHPWCTGRPAT